MTLLRSVELHARRRSRIRRLCQAILSAALGDGAPKSKGVQFVDARKVVVVDEDPDEGVTIDWESSARNARRGFAAAQICL